MTPDDFLTQHATLDPDSQVREIVSVLTGPGGCAWDQKQTAETVINFVIDEAHELKEALKNGERNTMSSELGDLLFTMEFLTQSLEERVPKSEAVEKLVEKMIRRHPHVFEGKEFTDELELKRNWEAEKLKEAQGRSRFDDDIPHSLGSIKKATKVLSRAMNSGFRYPKIEDAWDKVCEEFQELEDTLLGEGETGLSLIHI